LILGLIGVHDEFPIQGPFPLPSQRFSSHS